MTAEPDRPGRARLLFAAVIKPPYVWLRRRMITVLFDRRYGVYTADIVPLEALGVAADDRTDYIPSAWLALRRALPRRDVTNDDVFIDFGSGMGRVVLQAALTYPFRRVMGVEIAKQLHDIATENVARNRNRLRCSDVLLIQADVAQFDIPDDVTVVFLYNPFVGLIFEEFVRRLLASVDRQPRLVRIIYMNPREEAALLATGRVRLIRSLRGWRPTREWSRSNSTRVYSVSLG